MKNKSFALLFALSVLVGLLDARAVTAQSEADEPSAACALIREDTIEWTALGETVTFRTEMSGPTFGLPGASYTLIRADGTEIDLGGGGKFIDYGPQDARPSCEDHLDAAGVGTLPVPYNESTSRAPHTMTIRDYVSGATVNEVMSDAVCLAVDQERTRLYTNRPDRTDEAAHKAFWNAMRENDYAEAKCRDKRQIQQQFKDNPDTLRHLIAINAPLLDITGSTYFSDIVAFDPATNTLHQLFFWGC